MNIKVQAKVLNALNQFTGMRLKYGRIEERLIKGKPLLVLELTFSDDGLYRTMVLVLDKDLTEGDYKYIAEKLIQ